MNERENHRLDSEIQAYLDGELSPDRARAFEARVASDPALLRRVQALQRFQNWVAASRPEPRAAFGDALDGAIERGSGRLARPSLLETFLWRGFAWAGAAAAAAVVVLAFTLRFGSPSPVSTYPSSLKHEFAIDAPKAGEVCLVGSFNRWTVCATPLEMGADGRWKIAIDLPRGRYEYMFVVDGRWLTDDSAPVHVDDGFGNRNAVLII